MISAVVLTKDEKNNILPCLKTLEWCDEIIIVDDYSTDKTTELAEKFGAKVYRRRLDGDFSAQRNFGLKKANNEWIFFVDADERVPPRLAQEIKKMLENSRFDAYTLTRQDIFMGRVMRGGEWGSIRLLRLGRRGVCKWVRKVHEQWITKAPPGHLSSPLLHSPALSLGAFLTKLNSYAILHADSNRSEGKEANFGKVLCWPGLKFFFNFVLKRGYRDGVHGFVFAVLMSFHSFLAWSKLWLDTNRKER